MSIDINAKGFVRREDQLSPADLHALEWLRATIPNNREALLTIRMPRSPEHHRWFFALLKLVTDNTDKWPNVDELLDSVKLAVGHTERWMPLGDGPAYLKPRSINFASMGQDKFKDFAEKALTVLSDALGFDARLLIVETDASQNEWWQKTFH